ncbi:uncharacterized protein LOC119647592 isoform X2 [Hermetia illucens]|uniref:uncharacterized protein LOC119647592 isoform X2 n=1 Tax=Hermetia illucens TaxID=343691 RepID=UPI0018CC144F|nr:uncharacterized protein LOC119647592 isoform X2 [Hermetia illucens]
MGTKSPGTPQRCRLILQRCLAIQLSKPGHTPQDFWMYDSGYMIFQNFLAANAQCWWNAPLSAATRALRYAGHVAPGMLLVTAEPCALEVLRGAYARSVLKPPATYVISSVGDIDDCIVTPTVQGQFTPLPEALCDVIMDLTAQGQSATIENIRAQLSVRFPHMTTPVTEVIYDTLAQLMKEKKIYQTSKGYFIVTPERRRSRSRPRSHRIYQEYDEDIETQEARTMLMTNSEALHSLYGEISTERDGDLTHQCIQTNLADVICGGNPNDKILYPRTSKRRSASFPTPRSLERRHSLRLFGSSKRLQRCASTRSLSKNYAQTLATDSSSSEYQSTDSSSPSKSNYNIINLICSLKYTKLYLFVTVEKGSLLSRLFRRSGRSKQRQIETFSAQFPPAEWFNSRAVHLHSVGTQTNDHEIPVVHTLSNSTFYDGSEYSQRSSTLPRRHRRHMSSESTFVISSRDCSPIRRRSPAYCSSSLPRSTQSIPATSTNVTQNQNTSPAHHQQNSQSLRVTSHTPKPSILGKHFFEEQNRIKAKQKQLETTSIMDNKVNYRSAQSGPSSLESGKASMITTSGPSSLESTGKMSYSRTSGHSSLESQASSNTVQQSPSRSVLIVNGGSPRNSAKYQTLRQSSVDYGKTKTSGTSSGTKQFEDMPHVTSKPPSGIPNSNSNSSITLQVTTSNGSNQSNIPSTKIFVQNSPVRSVITLENGKLAENSNVFIINNETTTNEKGELIKKPTSVSRQQHFSPLHTNGVAKKDSSISENDANSETCDSISFISETSPEHNDIMSSTDVLETTKFTKNINNDATMNNSRKLSLHISPNGSNNNKGPNNIVYKNVLKNESDPTSPTETNPVAKQDFEIAGSVGNLRYYEKNTIGSQNKLNSHCDLKNLRYESSGNLTSSQKGCLLTSNPAINTDSLAHILQKNIIAVGSEPNLAIKNCEQHQKSICEKSVEKETLDRRLSLSKENTDELYNFPSLTDLSFNFTSLAAQKILQGVSLNSIDTLVELNMANNKEKQKQNNQTQAMCTDYGMV